MALFGQDAPDPRVVAGGAALGDLITGGPAQRAGGAYTDQFRKNATAADAMWKARDSRARAISREGLNPETLVSAGYDPRMAPVLSNVLGASATPNLRNLGDFANPADAEIDKQRREALAKGDTALYNRLTALATDKAYQPARIAGGVITPDGVGLGDEAFEVRALPQTEALIEQREASADATRVRADAYADSTRDRAAAYADRQRRDPAPRSGKSLSPAQVEAKMAFITAQATEHAKAGKPDEWVQAWMANEAAKAGIDMQLGEASAPEAPVQRPPSVEVREGFVSFDDIPSAARSKLKEGVVTKFGNGQSWMLRKGQPVRVK